MLIEDEATWPVDLVRFIEQNQALFDDWHGPTSEARVRNRRPGDHSDGPRFPAFQYDDSIRLLARLLNTETLESGFHCTRLTLGEIDAIQRSGMQLQDAESLNARLRRLERDGLLTAEAARTFSRNNSADESNRAGKIWFCFFAPHLAGESGIDGFFRYWGGEALYRSHWRDPVNGPLLQSIGVPAIVVADVPIAWLNENSSLSINVIRRYFHNRGTVIREDMDHEGYAVRSLPVEAIRRIVLLSDPEFIQLTRFDTWRVALV